MKINPAALYAGLNRIREHPEEWDQKGWVCETGGCFAYHVAIAAGWSPTIDNPFFFTKEGRKVIISEAATYEITGEQTELEDEEDTELFYKLFATDLDTYAKLEQAVKDFINDNMGR